MADSNPQLTEPGFQTPVALVETDTYCVDCGYNLRQQTVYRDERLRILVVRCPECGRFVAATTGTLGLSGPAARRFGWILLILYMLMLLFVGGCTAFGLGLFQIGYAEAKSRSVNLTELPSIADEVELFAVAGGIAFVTGVSLAVLMWHWRRRWWIAVALMPVVIGAVAAFDFYVTVRSRESGNLAVMREVWHTGLAAQTRMAFVQMVGLAVGLNFGRPVCRLLLSILLTPRPRQKFAFLWLVDHRKPPRVGLRNGERTEQAGPPSDSVVISDS